MTRLLAAILATTLAVPNVGHAAAPEAGEPSERGTAPTGKVAEVLNQAEAAWRAGEWSEVRALLQPVALDPTQLEARGVASRALPMLTDATLLDDSLDVETRTRLASRHLDRLLEMKPDYRMPEGVYTPQTYELFQARLEAMTRSDAASCLAERNACEADLAQARFEHEELRKAHRQLQNDHAEQEVEVRTEVKRSRAWALLPLGIGHFYNGNLFAARELNRAERRNVALGATFLTLEAGFGAAGLGLLIWRNLHCTRTRGFQPGSLECELEQREPIIRRRQAEEVMGWMLIGSVALDIVLAQILFEPTVTESVERKTRRELEAEGKNSPDDGTRRRRRPRAKVRPSARGGRSGFSLGVNVRF